MTATAPTAPGVRSWWGIPFATAERYRRPVLADFDPDRPYDRKGVAPVQPDSGDWLSWRTTSSRSPRPAVHWPTPPRAARPSPPDRARRPAVTDRPTSESVGNPPYEPSAHYQAALDLFENLARP